MSKQQRERQAINESRNESTGSYIGFNGSAKKRGGMAIAKIKNENGKTQSKIHSSSEET